MKSQTPGPQPDATSSDQISLLRDASQVGGAHFLYRQRETEAGAVQYEMTRFTNVIRDRHVQTYLLADLDKSWKALSVAASLLSAVLHISSPAVILVPFAEQFAYENPSRDDEDELYAPPQKSNRPKCTMARGSDSVIALLSHLDQTVVFAIPMAITLPITYAEAFAGAIGPLHFDQAHDLQRAASAIPGRQLTMATAQKIINTMGDPAHAAVLFSAAKKLSKQRQQTYGNIDQLVDRLATSMTPVISGARISTPKATLGFDPDLFVSEPSLAPYFKRAAQLRMSGAKFLIAGEPGTGKTAVAGALAQKMSLPMRELRGSDLFGRWWGTTERLIKRAFDEAIADRVILFLDEADALLIDRSRDDSAKHLAVAATSEFLKYLAAHDLPIIAATNHLKDIDKAAIRRFDIVVQAQSLPEDREALAWKRIIKLEPPANFHPIGGTVVADYVLARRRIELFDQKNAHFALAALCEARDARCGIGKPNFGFL